MTPSPGTLLRSIQSTQRQLSKLEARADAPLLVLYIPSAARDRAAVRDRLSRAGAAVSVAADITDALQMLTARQYSAVVVDLAGERSALAVIRVIKAQHPGVPLVGVMDSGHPVAAAEAVYAGVADLLPWPIEEREAMLTLTAARDRSAVDPAAGVDPGDRLFLHSAAMRLVADAMRGASTRKTAVLLCGAPGTGRRLIARTLHASDDEYVNRPFIEIDCTPEGSQDLERRLFGTPERGGDSGRAGLECVGRASAFVAAQGGTLYLTQIVEASARVQDRLARILRDREAFSVDAQDTIALDVRVIAAAGPDADGAVADGRLRRDLFERLAQVRIDAPALSRRREDLPLLAALFLRRACEADRIAPKRFSRAALSLLAAMPWRGNAGELQDVITAIVRATRQPVIQLDDVLEHARFDAVSTPAEVGLSLREARARFEREWIGAALMRHHGRAGDAAKALGIQRTNLYRKVRQLKVSRSLLSSRK